MVVAIGTLGLIMVTWPLAHSLPAAMLLIGLGGLADGPALASTFAVRQQHTPRHLHGQVMTTAVGLKIGMLALGAGSAGILVEALDPSSVVLIAAALQLVAVCVGWVVMRDREPVAVLP
jgi:predicted MFS family arabinose efflux permease